MIMHNACEDPVDLMGAPEAMDAISVMDAMDACNGGNECDGCSEIPGCDECNGGEIQAQCFFHYLPLCFVVFILVRFHIAFRRFCV